MRTGMRAESPGRALRLGFDFRGCILQRLVDRFDRGRRGAVMGEAEEDICDGKAVSFGEFPADDRRRDQHAVNSTRFCRLHRET